MKTFDDIEVRRPDLARSYLSLLAAQPGRPLALFAPRRIGKTFFLDHELAPAAIETGILPVYVDLWLHRSAPLDAINHRLEETLDDLTVPNSSVGKLAKTKVKKLGLMGASIDLGDQPQRKNLPDVPELRLDTLMSRLIKQHSGKILVMLDEVQTLAEVSNGAALIGTLRAVLHSHKNSVYGVFTGSSQEGLARMMNTVGAPMYMFAQQISFPYLGDEFLTLLATHYKKVHQGKTLDLDALRHGFNKVGFKPALMRDVVKGMSAEGITNVDKGLEHYMSSDQQIKTWQALLDSTDAFGQGILIGIAKEMTPLSKEMAAFLKTIPGAKPTVSKVRSSIERLKSLGLVTKTAAGTTIDDPLFAAYLAKKP